jgi:hypothetical protein
MLLRSSQKADHLNMAQNETKNASFYGKEN